MTLGMGISAAVFLAEAQALLLTTITLTMMLKMGTVERVASVMENR